MQTGLVLSHNLQHPAEGPQLLPHKIQFTGQSPAEKIGGSYILPYLTTCNTQLKVLSYYLTRSSLQDSHQLRKSGVLTYCPT